jgi:lipopolysaccharide transport system permease protein
MYATPVIYPLSTVPERYRLLIALNPMTPVIETFRHAFLGGGAVDGPQLIVSGLTTIAVLFLGLMLFTHVERTFMDTV